MDKKSKTKLIKPKPKPKPKTKVIKPNKKNKTKVIIGGKDKKHLIKESKSKFLIFHSTEYTDVAELFKKKLDKELKAGKKHKTIKVDFEDTKISETIMNEYKSEPLINKRIVIMFKKDRNNNEYGAREYFRKVTNLLINISNKLKEKKIFVFFPFQCRQDQGSFENATDENKKFEATEQESITSMNYYHHRLHLMRKMFIDINRYKNLKTIYFFNLDRLEVVKNKEADNIFQNTGHIDCKLNYKSEQRFNGVFDLIIDKEFRPNNSPHDPDCSKTFKIDITSENNYLGDDKEVQEANRWEMGIKCRKLGDPIDSFGYGNFRELDTSKSLGKNTLKSNGSSNLQQKYDIGTGRISYAQVLTGKGLQEMPVQETPQQIVSKTHMTLLQAQQPSYHLEPPHQGKGNGLVYSGLHHTPTSKVAPPQQPSHLLQQPPNQLQQPQYKPQQHYPIDSIQQQMDQYQNMFPNPQHFHNGGANKKQEYKKYKIKEVLGKNKQIFKEKDKKSKKEYIKHKKEYILVKDYIKLMKK
jgi:hypothetical protein